MWSCNVADNVLNELLIEILELHVLFSLHSAVGASVWVLLLALLNLDMQLVNEVTKLVVTL